MNWNSADLVVTAHPAKRHGISIPKDLYDRLCKFIVNELLTQDEHTSISLLEEAEQTFTDVPNLYWYLMHVRLDLEAKGYVRMTDHRDLTNRFLRITNRGMRNFNGSRSSRI